MNRRVTVWLSLIHISLVLDNDCFGNQRLLEMKTVPIYIKNIVSDTSFEMIYELNKKENISKINLLFENIKNF